MIAVKGSGALLEALFIKYRADYKRKFPEAPALQKKQVSSWVDGGTHGMARWTNEKAHQGKYPNWRIPIKRIPEICELLKATDSEFDQLMAVRIQEAFIQYHDSSVAYETATSKSEADRPEMSDGLAVVSWLGPVLRLPVRAKVLNDEEAKVLDAYNDAKRKAFGEVPFDIDFESRQNLPRLFDTFFEGATLKPDPYVVEETEDALAKLAREKIQARLLATMAANAAKKTIKLAAAKAPTIRDAIIQVDTGEVARRNNLLPLVGVTPKKIVD